LDKEKVMKRRSLWILLLFIAVVAASFYLKRTLSGPESSKAEAKVDQIFEPWAKPDSPGAALAVVKGNKVVYAKGYGSANLEYGISITPSTVFHVASVSKQFTAFAIALLSDQGKLSLDDDIRLYLPEIPDFGRIITIRHLVHHISGLRDQWELLAMAGWRLDDVITTAQIMKLVGRQKELNFNPGDEYLYSNTGFTLLAEIVERITETSFREWTTSNIFEPLGMAQTHFHDDHETIVKNRAYSYSPAGKEFRKRVLSFATVGATSLFTTVEDLSKWVKNFNQKKVGNDAVLARMLEQGVLNSGEKISYAFGLDIGESQGVKTVSHSGSDAGFRSHLLMYPDEDLAVIVLSNLSSINSSGLAGQVSELYLPKRIRKPAEKKEEKKEIQLNSALLKAYEGQYQFRPDSVVTIERIEDRLTAQITGSSAFALHALSETRFFRRDSDIEITFHLNNIGQVTHLTLTENGREARGEKISSISITSEQKEELRGDYYSSELDTIYRIDVLDGQLTARHIKHDDIPLQVITPDYYSGSPWFFRIVHIIRDGDNSIVGFQLTGSRVRNLRFQKIDYLSSGSR
jgi:CubicO group peptidase (beta-lactamase class C family)